MRSKTLAGQVALVAGASRGAGRGVARALGEAGATVVITGRTHGPKKRAPDGFAGTLEETAGLVEAAGGRPIPIACDHTSPEAVAQLLALIERDHGRLDVLVSAVWGGNETNLFSAPFWEQPTAHYDLTTNAGARAHYLTLHAAAPLLVQQRRGLAAVVSFDDDARWIGNFYYDVAKAAMNRVALAAGEELRPYGVTSVALSPGHMRTERVVAAGVPLDDTESTLYVGRAVVALATDPAVLRHTGRALHVGTLAREYGFTDEDGTQPPRFHVPGGS